MIKAKNTEAARRERNLIAEKTTITGNIHTTGDIRIDGILNGDIQVKGKLVLGNSSKVKGNVNASEVEIAGNFLGDIKVLDMLTVKSTARIEGNVTINKLLVEPGAVFNAKCTMGKQEKKAPIYAVSKR